MKDAVELVAFVCLVAGVAWLSVPCALIVGGATVLLVSFMGRVLESLSDRGSQE
jgi:hypothetical protein